MNLPYDSSETHVFDNFLDKDVFSKTLSTIELVDKQVPPKAKIPVEHIGNSIEFLHYYYGNQDKKILNNVYLEESVKNNNYTRQYFDFLYENIRENLSKIINIPCVYRDDMLRPYIRIWKPSNLGLGVQRDNNKGFHYDSNIFFIDYKKLFGIIPLNTISATIALEIPDFSEFEYLPESRTNDRKIIFDDLFNTAHHTAKLRKDKKEKIPENFYENKVVHSYELNQMVFQWNHTIHRIGKMKFSNMNQRRITVQLTGIHDGEKIWLTS